MSDYKLTKIGVIRAKDGAFIPANEENGDYRRYLRWLAEGNTPDPEDPPVVVPDVQGELIEDISAANNIAELKAALTGQGPHGRKVGHG